MPRIIQKIIGGTEYFYDKIYDTIYSDSYLHSTRYNRTQVDKSVDICIELTTNCNFACSNCFSDSKSKRFGINIKSKKVISYIRDHSDDFIRVCLTGGEPMLHPEVDAFLHLAQEVKKCGFVLSTNGTSRADLDETLIRYKWLVAISLHGSRLAHNSYTSSQSFDLVVERIRKIAKKTVVHIYTVLHDGMTEGDIKWLFSFRDEANVAFLRFIVPRPYGRFNPLHNTALIEYVGDLIDKKSGLKSDPSLSSFITASGIHRQSN